MIITGCMRSGTKSAADIFGVVHETFFNPNNLINIHKELPKMCCPSEASWLAQPYASTGNDLTVDEKNIPHKIIHLVRHPLAVIRSLIGIEFFDKTSAYARGHEPYYNFLTKYLPKIKMLDCLGAAIYYYIEWNKPLMRLPRIRIEDISNCPQLNSRNRANVSWADIQKYELAYKKLKEMTKELYYE